MHDLYETVTTNYNNTGNHVALIYEGTHKMVFTVSVMPGIIDQQGNVSTRLPGSLRGQTRWTPQGPSCPTTG